MLLCLHCNRLGFFTVYDVTSVFAEFFTDFFMLLIPVRPTKIIHTNRWIRIDCIFIVRFRDIPRWEDRAGSECNEFVQVVDKEFFF